MPLQDQINPTWPEIIEFEINRRGGEATVGEIVALMMELGWSEPAKITNLGDGHVDT